jgi:hypothetical protein
MDPVDVDALYDDEDEDGIDEGKLASPGTSNFFSSLNNTATDPLPT